MNTRHGRLRTFARAGALLLVLALGACARSADTTGGTIDRAAAQAVWDRFTALSGRAENLAGPFEASATLYYSGKEDSQRVSTLFWGNGNSAAPLRLDILMGPGSVIAQAREESRGLFIYVPRENLVYHAQERGLLSFGVPVPFTLADLMFLVTGRFGGVFAPSGTALSPAAPESPHGENGNLVFSIADAPLPGSLTLSPEGLPLAWEEKDGGWILAIDYWPESTRTTPRKLYIKHHDGAEATFIVRELNRPGTAFPAQQMQLNVPPNTRLAPVAPAR